MLADAPLTKVDALVASGTGLVAATLFARTFSSHVALGDAPESVAGVDSLGILHAPGYPSYVLAARAFAAVVAVGGWAFRVNLFSLACATLLVVAVYILARFVGAGIAGSAIGALALATSASIWFNAAFAKHYAFTGLLVTGAAVLAMSWQRQGRNWLLVLLGVVLGIGLGAGWQLALVMMISVGLLLAFGNRRPETRPLISAGVALVSVAGAIWIFVLVRARQNPAVNWGEATDLHRLTTLVLQKDFGLGDKRGNLVGRTAVAFGGLARDLGFAVIALAIVGAAVGSLRLGRDRLVFLGFAFAANLLAVAAFAGFGSMQGFKTTIVQGGFLVLAVVVIALLAALGVSYVLGAISEYFDAHTELIRAVSVMVIALVVIVPSAVVHYKYADFDHAPLADNYSKRMLAGVPTDGVLLTFGAEYAFPMQYRQIVHGERPDVKVISLDQLNLDWGREKLAREYNLGTALEGKPLEEQIPVLTAKLRQSHRVFLDQSAMQGLSLVIGYRSHGLVGEVVDGTGAHDVDDVDALAAMVETADRDDGLRPALSNRIPERTVHFFHERAHIELAKIYAMRHNLDAAKRELQRALAIFPSDGALASQITALEHPDADAMAIIQNA